MGIKEQINERPMAALGAVAAGLVVALAFATLTSGRPSRDAGEAFFSTDDGKSWFAAPVTNVPPFERDGKQAVRAYVYRAGGKAFVNHLERYTAEGQRVASARFDGAGAKAGAAFPKANAVLVEVKRPGDAKWVAANDAKKAAAIVSVRPPAGQAGEVESVEP
jgi:hypothetical protein